MTVGNLILTIIVYGFGVFMVLLFAGLFVWGIIDAIKEHRRVKKERMAKNLS